MANATVELPDILVDQEVEVLHDEFRTSLARQGIAEEAYLKAVGQTEADLHTEFRPRAESRVKTLLVLSKIAEVEGIEVTDADVEAEVDDRPGSLRRRCPDADLLRFRARAELHPEHAPADADGRGPGRSLAGRPSGPPGACPTSRRTTS